MGQHPGVMDLNFSPAAHSMLGPYDANEESEAMFLPRIGLGQKNRAH